MAIYDKNGNKIFKCYDAAGHLLTQAFNKYGEVIYPELKVMSYNVQHFTGINSQLTMQQKIINDNKADIIGVQEINTTKSIPAVGQAVFADYQYKELSNHKNFIAMISKLPLSNIVIADFEHQDPEDMSRWGETRAYMLAEINVGGKTITWLNTHLCVVTTSVKYQQMEEVFDILETKEYAIATGDFNIGAYTSLEDAPYVNMIKQFADAGYNIANNRSTGHTNTFTDATTASSLSDLTKPHDDIITTGNIDILDVKFDTTKFSYPNGSPIDHIPVIATLQIN